MEETNKNENNINPIFSKNYIYDDNKWQLELNESKVCNYLI